MITEERKQDVYPAATLEGSLANSGDAIYVENQYYSINSANVVSKSDATALGIIQITMVTRSITYSMGVFR